MNIPDWLERQMKRSEEEYQSWPAERREEYNLVYSDEVVRERKAAEKSEK